MNIYIPSLEEARQYRFIPESYEWPDDADKTSQVNLVQPMLEGRRLYWEQWRKDNPDYKSKWKKYEAIGKENWQKADNTTALNKTILECPHCGKTGNVGNMKRWHFDNCGKVRKFNKDAKGRFT